MLSIHLTPDELRDIESPVTAAAIKLRLGAVDEELRETLAAVINVAYYICKSTQRHAHLLPEIMRASDAALDGYNDVDALDVALEIYRALIRTTRERRFTRPSTAPFGRTRNGNLYALVAGYFVHSGFRLHSTF